MFMNFWLLVCLKMVVELVDLLLIIKFKVYGGLTCSTLEFTEIDQGLMVLCVLVALFIAICSCCVL
jgi:hypothetical protein